MCLVIECFFPHAFSKWVDGGVDPWLYSSFIQRYNKWPRRLYDTRLTIREIVLHLLAERFRKGIALWCMGIAKGGSMSPRRDALVAAA